MKTLTVVAAVIVHAEHILCVQRGPGKYTYTAGKWELPGGKVAPGESNREALCREIKEELALDITVREHCLTVDHQYPDFRILLHAYQCTTLTKKLILTEHIDYRWLPATALPPLDWAAADVPIIKQLLTGPR